MSEFLMLAQTFDANKHRVGGWFVSEKFDGQRCFWDGGITRGIPKKQIPWANNDKDERYLNEPIATGLWSRYGNVIHAPHWFLDKLPSNLFLDGELWIERGAFQQTRSIISRLQPVDDDWAKVQLLVFDTPTIPQMFTDRTINNVQFKKQIDSKDCFQYTQRMARKYFVFEEAYGFLDKLGIPHLVRQQQLPVRDYLEKLYELLDDVVARGGEGLMLRDPTSIWTPKRANTLLKVKPMEMDEGEIVGYTAGKGKYIGMLGAVIVKWNGGTFELSGFTDQERRLTKDASDWAMTHEGEVLPSFCSHRSFPLGTLIRFKYTSLTDSGVPREARYARGRN